MRIMTWNIEHLKLEKIQFKYNADNKLKELIQDHILNNIMPNGINITDVPAIISVQEIMCKNIENEQNILNQSNSQVWEYLQLLRYLLWKLNNRYNTLFPNNISASPWYVVPPLGLTNYRQYAIDRIAVFFNSSILDFVGPNVLKNLNNKKLQSISPTDLSINKNVAPYPFPFNTLLPSLPKVSLNKNNNDDEKFFKQNQLAGTCINIESEGKNFRQPWLVKFREKSTLSNPRTISVISCHAPSKTNPSAPEKFFTCLYDTLVKWNKPQNDEIQILLGDFNLTGNEVSLNQIGFNFQNFTKHFNDPVSNISLQKPENGTGPNLMLSNPRSRVVKECYVVDYYSRSGNDRFNGALVCFDNIFTRNGDSLIAKPQNPKILDRVDGTPSTNVHKGPIYGVDMELSFFDINLLLEAALLEGALIEKSSMQNEFHNILIRKENYTHIRFTSDHMALVLDI